MRPEFDVRGYHWGWCGSSEHSAFYFLLICSTGLSQSNNPLGLPTFRGRGFSRVGLFPKKLLGISKSSGNRKTPPRSFMRPVLMEG